MEPDVIASRRGDEPSRWQRWRERPALRARNRARVAATVVAGVLVAGGPAVVVLALRSYDPDTVPAVSRTLPVSPPSRTVSEQRLPVPPVGGIAGGTLADGTLVYVVRTSASRARVLEAVSPIRQSGLGIELAWCKGAGVFIDPDSGLTFDRLGRFRWGPVPRDLPYYRAGVARGALVLGAYVRPTGHPHAVRPALCPARAWRYAQFMLPKRQSAVGALPRGGLPRPLIGVLSVSRGGEVRICDGFEGRADCGSAGYPVAGVTASIAGGRYPWVLGRQGYGRLGRDGLVHDLAVVGSATPQPQLLGRDRHVSITRVSGRTVTAVPVVYLSGDEANLAATADNMEVPVPDDYYIPDEPAPPARDYRLRSDATFTVVELGAGVTERRVGFRRWTGIARHAHGLWLFRLDPAGQVRSVRQVYRP